MPDVKARDARSVFVVQCKHTIQGRNAGVQVLYAANGTARPVHGADMLNVATNAGFTRHAVPWAPQHGIHLLDRDKLGRWAGEGHSLFQVLGIPEPSSRETAGCEKGSARPTERSAGQSSPGRAGSLLQRR